MTTFGIILAAWLLLSVLMGIPCGKYLKRRN